MQLKPNYFLIPLVTILVAVIGSYFTSGGMEWYATLIRPELTPPRWVFPVAWNVIFICATISALLVWNRMESGKLRTSIMSLFAGNAVLNLLWSYLFFANHLVWWSFGEMLVLELTVFLIIVLVWKKIQVAGWLMLPYLTWVALASYLTWEIIVLNY